MPYPRPLLVSADAMHLFNDTACDEKADAAMMMQLGCDGGQQYNSHPTMST